MDLLVKPSSQSYRLLHIYVTNWFAENLKIIDANSLGGSDRTWDHSLAGENLVAGNWGASSMNSCFRSRSKHEKWATQQSKLEAFREGDLL